MILVWGEQELVNTENIAFPLLPPSETPASLWDTWDFRGLFNQPLMTSQQQPPNNQPLAYPVPWQFYPK